MKIISRKTNVRRHNRNNKHVVANVRNHERNLKPRKVLGVIPLKNLKYKQAKSIFPTLEPNGDIDQDGVVNSKDCRPFDVDRQDEEEDDYQRRAMQDALARHAAAEAEAAEARERQIEADENISDLLAGQKQKERGSFW